MSAQIPIYLPTYTCSLGCAGKWLGDCATRYGSSIEEGSGNGLVTLVSVEKLRGTDLDHGEIGATQAIHQVGVPDMSFNTKK